MNTYSASNGDYQYTIHGMEQELKMTWEDICAVEV